MNSQEFCPGNFSKLAIFIAALILIGCFPTRSLAQDKGEKTFSSAEEASQALYKAAKANDEQAMLEVLGPAGKQIISSGDPAQDAEHRANFAKRYEEMHRLVSEPDGSTTLIIGVQNWPTPIPLLQKDGKWYFDTEKGAEAILYRRIGHNELSAIMVCKQIVEAEKEYYSQQGNVYAQKIASDEGQKNGLYWPVTGSQPESPVGPLVAEASLGGYKEVSKPQPFHGYFFRILTRQGKNAPGGAENYVVDGKMTAGFAVVAFPAEYRNSGVMTIIVNKDGAMYQKDLGKKTETAAKHLKEFNPDNSWAKVEEQGDQTASSQKPQ
jgi:hypothetical protein